MTIKDLPIGFFRIHTKAAYNMWDSPRDVYLFPSGLSVYVKVRDIPRFPNGLAVCSQSPEDDVLGGRTHSVGIDYTGSNTTVFPFKVAPDIGMWVTEARAMEILCALRDWKPSIVYS